MNASKTVCPMCCQEECRCAQVFTPIGKQPPTYPQNCVACLRPLNASEVARNKIGEGKAACDRCMWKD